MNFQTIPPIEDFQFYLDLALRKSREKKIKLTGGIKNKSKQIELTKIGIISDTIISRMNAIIKSYPSLNSLPKFYLELVKLTLDYGSLRKSLGAINWSTKQVRILSKNYRLKVKRNQDFDNINKLKGEYIGRIASVLKQIKNDFVNLENGRKIMKSYPHIKTSLKTYAVSGFPNVGKTTLLYKLTGSKPEINSYPFTTKGVNVAYLGLGQEKVQLLDTPGTLNRFEKMNKIEKIAYLAIEHCANKIIYVFDLTEEYPLAKQVRLYQRLKKDFDKEIIIYLSKTDIIDPSEIKEFKEKYECVTNISVLKKLLTP